MAVIQPVQRNTNEDKNKNLRLMKQTYLKCHQ
jgi:hypothetical protein